MMHLKFKSQNGWRGQSSSAGPGCSVPRQEFRDAQKLLALVYAAIRHDDAAVRAVDRKLKEKFGGGNDDS